MDTGREQNSAQVWDVKRVSICHVVAEYIDTKGTGAEDWDGFVFVSETNYTALVANVNVVDEHVAMGTHYTGGTRIGAQCTIVCVGTCISGVDTFGVTWCDSC